MRGSSRFDDVGRKWCLVVGSIYSGPSRGAAPVLAKFGIAQVSPTASNPSLTRGDAASAARQWETFFRVCPPDDVYGPLLGTYLSERGVRRVVTVHDGDEYGTGLVDAFAKSFTRRGGKVLATASFDPSARDYAAAVAAIVREKPQAVFFGGYDVDAAAVSMAVKKAGLIIPIVGGDGIYTPTYTLSAGPLSAGDVGALGGAPASGSDAGRTFMRDYRARRYDAPLPVEGALTYDATNVIIAALAKSVGNAATGKEARKAVTAAVNQVQLTGVSGPVAFDRFGDNRSKTLSFYRVSGGDWVLDKTVTVS